jgi:hypothetical protein
MPTLLERLKAKAPRQTQTNLQPQSSPCLACQKQTISPYDLKMQPPMPLGLTAEESTSEWVPIVTLPDDLKDLKTQEVTSSP